MLPNNNTLFPERSDMDKMCFVSLSDFGLNHNSAVKIHVSRSMPIKNIFANYVIPRPCKADVLDEVDTCKYRRDACSEQQDRYVHQVLHYPNDTHHYRNNIVPLNQ